MRNRDKEALLLTLIVLFVLYVCTSCGALYKAVHKQHEKKDSSATLHVAESVTKQTAIDSFLSVTINDSSVIKTEYQRTITAEDYFTPADSLRFTKPYVMRRVTTVENGTVKEQKAILEIKAAQHQDRSTSEEKKESVATVRVATDTTTSEKDIKREGWKLFSIENLLWLLILLAIIYITRRYLWPLIKQHYTPLP